MGFFFSRKCEVPWFGIWIGVIYPVDWSNWLWLVVKWTPLSFPWGCVVGMEFRICIWFFRFWNSSSCASNREDWRSVGCKRSRASNDPIRLWCSTFLFFWGFAKSNYRSRLEMVGVCSVGCSHVLVLFALGGWLILFYCILCMREFFARILFLEFLRPPGRHWNRLVLVPCDSKGISSRIPFPQRVVGVLLGWRCQCFELVSRWVLWREGMLGGDECLFILFKL